MTAPKQQEIDEFPAKIEILKDFEVVLDIKTVEDLEVYTIHLVTNDGRKKELIGKTIDKQDAIRIFNRLGKPILTDTRIRSILRDDSISTFDIKLPGSENETIAFRMENAVQDVFLTDQEGTEYSSVYELDYTETMRNLLLNQIAFRVHYVWGLTDSNNACKICINSGPECRECTRSIKKTDNYLLIRKDKDKPRKSSFEIWKEHKNWDGYMRSAFVEAREASHLVEQQLAQNPDADVQMPDPTIETEILDYAMSDECPPMIKLSMSETVRQTENDQQKRVNPVACALYKQAMEKLGCFYDKPKTVEADAAKPETPKTG